MSDAGQETQSRVGVDLVEIAHFGRFWSSMDEDQRRTMFADGELRAVCGRRDPLPGLAARFAAKEAVLKVLEVLDPFAFDWAQIEVVAKDSGAPSVRLHGEAAAAAAEQGLGPIALSMSHTRSHAMAFAQASVRDHFGTVP